ncbi:MAG: site-2 protease family protein [Candidatus Ventricola sp.]
MLDTLRTILQEPIAFFDQAIYRVLAVLIGLCCHEFGHAYAAYKSGDDTAKRAGRLTLNPLHHLDPLGALLMFFAGFGWAKPVPVNPYNYKGNRVKADLRVSLAGITVNLILFALFTYLLTLISGFMWDARSIEEVGLSALVSYREPYIAMIINGYGSELEAFMVVPALLPLARLFGLTSLINLNLAVFNLLPIPPLDGYHVVNDLVLRGKLFLSQRAFQIAMVVVMVLAAQGVFDSIIQAVIGPAQAVLLWPVKMIWG